MLTAYLLGHYLQKMYQFTGLAVKQLELA